MTDEEEGVDGGRGGWFASSCDNFATKRFQDKIVHLIAYFK